MSICQVCKEISVKVLLDCGRQPLCNRFTVNPDSDDYRHSLVLGQCETCGLIQLSQPVPTVEITPRFDWLKYNEPEQHLDNLSEIICNLPGITDQSTACGISYKDDTILRRLNGSRFSTTWRIDPEADLGIIAKGVGAETVIPYLTSESASRLAEKNGRVDVIIARHVYEHAPDTHRLLDAIKILVKPSGYVVFEVPDCTQVLDTMDYSMLWEEHNLYFTIDTFSESFGYTDFSLVQYKCYPYPVENALVAVVQLSNNKLLPSRSEVLDRELVRGDLFGKGFGRYRGKLKEYLKSYQEKNGKIAVFGAGHLACMYINLMEISDYIEYVVDDHPDKNGLYMPGSHLPICSSQRLIDDNISLCLLSLSPESEAKVKRKNQAYIEQGGMFASIFPASNTYLSVEPYKERLSENKRI